MIRALIADDEPHLATNLRDQLLALWPGLEIVALARNGPQAAEAIAALQPDVAFLDIQMPGLTGLEVAQGIEGATRVVFVTAYDEYALPAFDAEALDYLLKPVTRERLTRCVERLQRRFAVDAADADDRLARVLRRLQPAAAAPLRWIRAGTGDVTHQIAVQDVLYFRADEKYTCVQTASAEHLIRTPIAELATQLDAQQFWQIHRSTLVNLAHLAGTYVHLFKAM